VSKKEFMHVKLDSQGEVGLPERNIRRGARDFSRRSASNWT
jgi:hypothetical protein